MQIASILASTDIEQSATRPPASRTGRTAREGTPMTTMAPPCTAERRGFRARLSTGPAAAAEARRRVRAAIASWQIPVDQDAALLLTSELVTNAVRHEPGQAVMLVISCSRGRLRVDVHDTARTWPAVADVPADAESGRGLLLVETLSDEWGFYRTAAGKAVYFTLVFGADQAPAAGGGGPQRVRARGRWTGTPPSAHRPRRAALTVPAARLPSA
jgi:anti-sigma regulatory factor (Ser/Thr protein kinase)